MAKAIHVGKYTVYRAGNGGLWCITWIGGGGVTITRCHGTKVQAIAAAQEMDAQDRASCAPPAERKTSSLVNGQARPGRD